ncbi:MAG: GNAT family N-acetyltransferase [Planctomycetota bacterium]
MLTVRKAVRGDIATLAQFNCEMARETESVELPIARITSGVTALFDDPGKGQYWICLQNDKIAGEIIVGQLMITYEWSDWRNANFWWIQSVYTIPAARGRGVYRTLHENVISEAKRAGACGVRLYVEHNNKGARAVYERLGMKAGPYEMLEIDFVIKRPV